VTDATTFTIQFAPGSGTDCGLCLPYCEPNALRAAGAPTAGQVLGESLILYAGTLRECTRCKTRFAGPNDERLCPVCSYRRSHPAGVRLPDTLLAQLPLATRAQLSAPADSDDISSEDD